MAEIPVQECLIVQIHEGRGRPEIGASSLRYTFHMAEYTPPTAVMVGLLPPEFGSIDAAIPVSSAVTRPSYALKARPSSWHETGKNILPSACRSSFQYFNTTGRYPEDVTQGLKNLRIHFRKLPPLQLHMARAQTDFDFIDEGRQIGRNGRDRHPVVEPGICRQGRDNGRPALPVWE